MMVATYLVQDDVANFIDLPLPKFLNLIHSHQVRKDHINSNLKCHGCCVPQVRNGHIKRITDNDIQSLVLEVEGTNVR